MIGFGSYGNNGGPYSSPPSSNLSASAPPFTIDRSPNTGYMPLVDLLEQSSRTGTLNNSSSLHNWLPPRSPTSETNFFSDPNLELNSVASPNNPYNYASLNTHLPHLSTSVSASADAFSYAQCGDGVAKPYYFSFLSPPTQKDGSLVVPDQTSYDWLSSSSHVAVTALDGSSNKDYSQRSGDSKKPAQWGGLWNGFSEWEQGNQGLFDGSFCCSKESDIPVSSMYENFMNQETHSPKGLNRGEEAMRLNRGKEAFHGINNLDSDKHGGSVNAENFNDKSFSGKTSNFLPADCSRSFLESLSGFPDSGLESPCFMIGTSSGHQIPYGASNEKHLKQHATDSAKSSPTPVIGPPVAGSGFSPSNNAPFKIVNLGSCKTDADMCSKKAPSFIDADGVKPAFDSSKLSIHLDIDDPASLGSYVTKNEEMLNKECISSDTLHHVLIPKSGPQTSNVPHEGFKLDLNTNENINSVEDSSENVDHYNHAVDSPCWKGVPATRSSPFDASVPETKRQEVFSNSNVQTKQIFQLNTGDKVSSQKRNDNMMCHEFGSPENGLEFPLNTSPAAKSTFSDRKSDDIVKIGSDLETKGIQHSNDIHEHGSRSTGCSDLKSSLNGEQNIQRNGLISENINEALQCVSPRLPFPMENIISSSVEDASTKLNKSNEGPSSPTIDVPVLVSTIRNLSELLLFHCTSGSYQLKQKDLETIQSMIDNLSVCASKNSEKTVSTQDSTSEKYTSDYLGDKNHKGFTLNKLQVTKTAGPILDLLADQNVHKGNKYYVAGKENDELLDSVSVRADVDIVDEDKAIQALKKVLTDNFDYEEEASPQALLYKNLWLEAEAALCSMSCKARFNRVKLEMENPKLPKSKDAHGNTITTEMDKVSRSEVSPDLNGANTLSPKAKGCATTKSQESSVLSTNAEDDDVMDRFQILRCRAKKSNYGIVADKDKPSSPKVSPHSNKVGKILPEANEETGSSKPDIRRQASSNSSTDKPSNDYEASVMARFHILKSRGDNCSPLSTQGQLAENVDGSTIGSKSEVGSSCVEPEPTLQHHDADSTEGQLTGGEFPMFIDYDSMSQSHRPNRRENSLLAGWFDRVSSEWEHVGKEELGLQNR
ncbi:uncharacterized protein LOC21386167 isoform X2 [Morus notabilis]|uniref:uncharacterized protein LOC21386167 isoform X1 n=1 Tax=Morus notabilis TaxID=981085 RepID=UPI000CED241D|nr:uncharacterized protein LOC21386167 isoform X1 [Morus notabilis]XP_024025660.1 uncharacterized protein LOC21386167 isoform X2 [Morus notabilis]